MPRVDLGDAQGRTQDPGAQQPLTHRRDGRVQRAKECDLRSGIGKERLNQLQIAHRNGVEHQAILAIIEADAIKVMQGSALSIADVVEDRTCRGSGGWTASQPKAFQREHTEMILKERNRVVGGKGPVFERGLGEAKTDNAGTLCGDTSTIKERQGRWIEQLTWTKLRQF